MTSKAIDKGEDSKAVELARRWLDALNARDSATLGTLLSDDFVYRAMVRNPPEMAMRWNKQQFLQVSVGTAGASSAFRKRVNQTVVSAFGTDDRAVLETEGYSELQDGYVYANVYCFNFWIRQGKISAIHDYCCTHTAVLMTKHMQEAGLVPGR